tara:strand:+ start:88 stop:306 length:219 start_codon:yes stop_codon:yes gene_type:complete
MEEDVIDYVSTYDNAITSVNVLSSSQPEDVSDEDWQRRIQANLEHLIAEIERDWPEEFDLAPIEDAIAANEN